MAGTVTWIVIDGNGVVLHLSSKTLVLTYEYYNKDHETYDAGSICISA